MAALVLQAPGVATAQVAADVDVAPGDAREDAPTEAATPPAAATTSSAEDGEDPATLAPTDADAELSLRGASPPPREPAAQSAPTRRWRLGRVRRVRRKFVLLRALDTFWRFPASVVDMSPYGALHLAAMTGSVLALMWPAGPSWDVRIQDWVDANRSRRRDRAFPHLTTLENSIAYVVLGTGIAMTGWLSGEERIMEWMALMTEALAVTQMYVAIGKFLVGREAPYRDRSGRVNGPRAAIRGTPSGHMASFYTLLSVTAWYWNKPWLHALCHAVAIWLGIGLVYNDQHFLSDVLWGAGIGYYLGRWIVRHRAGRRDSRVPGPVFVPLFGNGLVGVSLVGRLD